MGSTLNSVVTDRTLNPGSHWSLLAFCELSANNGGVSGIVIDFNSVSELRICWKTE